MNNYLAHPEAKRLQELNRLLEDDDNLTEAQRQALEEERLAIHTLNLSRDLALEEACGQGGSAQACSYERALLQVAMSSWQDVTLGREDRDTVFAEYLHTARQHAQHQQQRMERIGAEALSEMVVDSVNAPIIMGQLVGQALLGDEESQAILREMGQEIKAFADNLPHSIPESISGSIREQLAQADALELAGQQDEADRLRVRVALENQSMLMGTGVLAASLPRLAKNAVTSRSGMAGEGDFSGSRVQDGAGVPSTSSATRARIEANISESRGARESSNFGDYFKAEGRVQEELGIWPPNRGAYGPVENVTIQPGELLDRYGFPGGTFVSPARSPFKADNSAFETRALPSYKENDPYNVYEVLKAIENAPRSKILPWFGQPGQGVQYDLPNSVKWYIDNGYLKHAGGGQ